MDKFLKKISLLKYIYVVYGFILVGFFISLLLMTPSIIRLSGIINSYYQAPEILYGSGAFVENPISDIGRLTSVYRGNFKRNGVYNNILPSGLKVLWESFNINGGIHGASKSSPAVDDSGVYVGGDDGWFYAFNHDGSLRWKYYTFFNFRGIHSTAMLSDKYVWFGSYNGRLYCLNKLNGKLMWSLKLADAIGSSPLLYKGFIYVSVETAFLDAYVLKINALNGKVVWRSPWLGEQIHSSVALNPKEKLLYVGANNGILYAILMDNGLVFWSYDVEKPIKGTPLVDIEKNRIYFSSWSRRLTSLHSVTGQIAWETYIRTPSQSSPTEIPTKDVLVISTHRTDSSIYGIRKSSGRILWRKKLENTYTGLHSGFSARNKKGQWLYYGACAKDTFCVLDPLTGEALQKVNIHNMFTGVPVPYKNYIYLSLNNGGLLKLGK